MDDYESLSHTKWDCKYHVVFIPKCRRKTLYVELRRHLGEVFRKLALQKESRIEEGHLMPDHVHMCVESDPSLAPARLAAQFKGYTSRLLRQEFRHLRSQLPSLWSRSYYIGSVGHVSESTVRRYIENQKGRH